MVDGKVVSALTNKNTTRCTICDKSGPEMAKNEGPFTAVSKERLEFGASPLHFGLRAFEALLHIGYKQDVKAFRAKKEDKQTVEDRTAAVKEAFKRQLGLVVDQRREGGFGTTNTGNVVRKAFANAEKTAAICGVSTMLVSNLDVIRRTLASGQDIHPEKFEAFCDETLNEYMSTVNWYNIPPTLHKVLVHGKDIVEATPMPVGWTSEEGSESNTKFAQKFHTNHTRKTSQEDTMSDLFNRLMDISDPVIVSHSKEKKKPQEYIPEDMAGLFKNATEPKNQEEVVENDIDIVSQFNISLCEDESNSE